MTRLIATIFIFIAFVLSGTGIHCLGGNIDAFTASGLVPLSSMYSYILPDLADMTGANIVLTSLLKR